MAKHPSLQDKEADSEPSPTPKQTCTTPSTSKSYDETQTNIPPFSITSFENVGK